ncbi:MAG: ABC transporter permease, partial [Sedimentisphaerales bacterium]
MTALINDIRFGIRQLLKQPLSSFIAILMLALGIGANTAVFGLLNSVLLRSLPVPKPDELRGINWVGDFCPGNIHGRITSVPNGEQISNTFTYPAFCEFRDRGANVATFFAYLGFNTFDPPTVQIRGQAFTADGMMVSGNFFQGLGLKPLLGRTIMPEHDRPNVAPVAVISYQAWQKYFGGDPNVIGQTIVLKQVNATVIGVLPKAFLGVDKGRRCDIYVPLTLQPQIEGICALESHDYWWVEAMARLKPSVDESQVSRLLGALFARMTSDVIDASKKNLRIVLTDGGGGLSGALAPRRLAMAKPLYLLLGLVGIVLLVTCVNLAGLLLARGAMRHHEFAVRAALGARRGRLIRQLLTESIVLSVIGVGCGFLLAAWIKPLLARILWPSDAIVDLQSDLHVYGFVLAILVFTTVLFGLLPALRTARANPLTHLKHRTVLGAPRLHFRKLLVSIQVGLSLLLLVAAGLFARTLINIRWIEAGFNVENLLVFRADINQRRAEFNTAVGSLPGVQAVTYSNIPLLCGGSSGTTIPLPGNPSIKLNILKLDVSETFLQTMRIPLLAGRDFQTIDTEASQRAIIVNQSLVDSAFPDESPIGHTLRIHQKDYTIVGVCGDTKYYDLKKAYEPIVFFPSRSAPFYAVRTTKNPKHLVPMVRQVLGSIDPDVALANVKTLEAQISENTLQERCFAWLALSLAFLAMLQSCIGLYGLMANDVTRRTGEIGIRMALGARPGVVAWPILRSALIMAGTGVGIGLPMTWSIVKIIRSYLFGIQPYDPLTLIVAVILLMMVTVLAAWIPARRAAKIDPMEAL